MSQELDNLTNEVSEEVGVIDSAIVLINGLAAQITEIKAQLEAQGIDNAKLNELSATLDLKGNELAQAVANNS